MLQQNRSDILPPDHRASVTVRRVGARIARAADKFAAQHGLEDQVKGSGKPTFTVIRSDMANAFVLPNNHVFVLTGLFRYARDEDELAAVLGHEQAHCLARHAGERVSGGFLTSIIARFVLLLDPTGVLYALFVPASALLRELPHSRDQEIEADHIGLYLAAEACYDPRAAKRVFGRMKAGDGGDAAATPEFVSTHPSYDTRLSKFDEWMPDALSQFNADGGYRCRHVREEMKKARILATQVAASREGK
jgi:predicted Zn-dependent protease